MSLALGKEHHQGPYASGTKEASGDPKLSLQRGSTAAGRVYPPVGSTRGYPEFGMGRELCCALSLAVPQGNRVHPKLSTGREFPVPTRPFPGVGHTSAFAAKEICDTLTILQNANPIATRPYHGWGDSGVSSTGGWCRALGIPHGASISPHSCSMGKETRVLRGLGCIRRWGAVSLAVSYPHKAPTQGQKGASSD